MITFVLLALALSYFVSFPAEDLGEGMILIITMFWMLLLAAIVATYALAVVLYGGDASVDRAGH